MFPERPVRAGPGPGAGRGQEARPVEAPPFYVCYLLIPDFPLMTYAAAVEPLRSANRLTGRTLYQWSVVTPSGEPTKSSSGMTVVPDLGVERIGRPNLVLVCAGTGVEHYRHQRTYAALRALARSGCMIGGISAGAYVLARAGLLSGYRCTIHWEQSASFAEEFPDVRVVRTRFELDRNRLTCAGGVASLDLALALIAGHHGPKLAAAVSDSLLHTEIRDRDSPQRMDPRGRFGVSDQRLLDLLVGMEANVEEPLTRTQLAQQAGVSVRQLDRLFKRHLGCSPSVQYARLRLQRARHMLQQTTHSVSEIAAALPICSFSTVAVSRCPLSRMRP